jgi:hypothetical protein
MQAAHWGRALTFGALALLFPISSPALDFSYIPGGATIQLGTAPNGKDVVRIELPIATLQSALVSQLLASGKVHRVRYVSFPYALEERQLGLAFGIDGSAGNTGYGCDVTVRFAIPAAQGLEGKLVDGHGPAGGCRPPGFLSSLVFAVILGLTQGSISKELVDPKTLEEMKKDTNTEAFRKAVWTQGYFCKDREQREALCLVLEMPKGSLQTYLRFLAKKAPRPMGEGDTVGLRNLRAEVYKRARFKESKVFPGYRYPAGYSAGACGDNEGWCDGDMALFGGLLCLSGEAAGCELLERAQDKDGRFWRAPDHIGQASNANHKTFSGDQFRGVAAYLIARRDRERLGRYLAYLSSTAAQVPKPWDPIMRDFDKGYFSCDSYPDPTCLLAGEEWQWLNDLARGWKMLDRIPPAERDPARRYGDVLGMLEYRAAFAPLGGEAYQAHLVGVQIYLLRAAGRRDPAIGRAAAILAARQPKNPFYLYLHLGKSDKRTIVATREWCSNVPDPQNAFDWSWQRDTDTEQGGPAYKRSMGWDCIFMLNNLLR